MPLALGTDAPDFTLRGSDDREVTLSSFRGIANVVLIFYPKDQTPGCTKQLRTARDDAAAFAAAGAVVFGVNGASAESHARFVAKHDLKLPLLVDRGLGVAKRYDAVLGFGPLTFVNRTVVGIGRDGRVAFYERGMPATSAILASFAG